MKKSDMMIVSLVFLASLGIQAVASHKDCINSHNPSGCAVRCNTDKGCNKIFFASPGIGTGWFECGYIDLQGSGNTAVDCIKAYPWKTVANVSYTANRSDDKTCSTCEKKQCLRVPLDGVTPPPTIPPGKTFSDYYQCKIIDDLMFNISNYKGCCDGNVVF